MTVNCLIKEDNNMSYDLHICRGINEIDRKEAHIILEEWENIVNNDVEMNMKGFAEAKLPNGKSLKIESNGLAVWNKKRLLRQDIIAYFNYNEGKISVSNPSDDIIKKMKDIANKLHAKVIGDDGEEY